MADKLQKKKSSWAMEVEEEHQLTGWAKVVSKKSKESQQNSQNAAAIAVPQSPGKSKKANKKGKGGINQNNLKPMIEDNKGCEQVNNIRGKPFSQSPKGKVQQQVDHSFKWELPARGRGTGKEEPIRPQIQTAQNFPIPAVKALDTEFDRYYNKGTIDYPALPGQSLKADKGAGAPGSLMAHWEQKRSLSISSQSTWGNSSSEPEKDRSNVVASGSNNTAKDILEALLPSERMGSEGFDGGATSNKTNSHPNCVVGIGHPDLNDVFCAEKLPDDEVPEDLSSDDDELDSDSDWVSGEDYDSDASEKSHETQKRNKAFCAFFHMLDALPQEDFEKDDRQWHCPVCKGGVGAIDWYRGLQPLLNHAKTVKFKKVKLHRNFHKVLEHELTLRQANIVSGIFGMWKGLREDEEVNNPLILWPPMVLIENTKLELDSEEDKWNGMGNKELLDHFKDYKIVKAKHAYGPQGHRGMSMLIFADSPAGYYEAQRLDQQFRDARRGREFWDKPSKLLFYHGGQRILYGYLAIEEDLHIFNRHCKGKTALKWEHKRLQEAVLEPMRHIDEDTQQIYRLRNKVEREKEHSKNLEKAFTNVSRKLRLREEEVQVINRRALEQTDDNQTQMDDLEHHQKRLEDIIMELRKKLQLQEQDIKVLQSKSFEQNKQNKEEMEALEQSYQHKLFKLKSDICEKEQAMQRVQEKFQEERYQRYEELEQQHSTLCLNMRPSEDQQQKKQEKLEEMSRESEMIEMSLRDVKDYEAMKMQLARDHHLRKLEFKRKQLEEEMAFQRMVEEEKLKLFGNYTSLRQDVEAPNGTVEADESLGEV